MKNLQTIICCLFLMIGVLCIFCAEHITSVLPYLLGTAMILAGIIQCVIYAKSRSASAQNVSGLSYGLVMLIMGLVFVAQGGNALGPMGTTWAIIGIRKASKSLEHAIEQMRLKQGFFLPIVEFFIRLTLALILLFDPFEKFSTHIVILGIELLVISVRLTGPHLLSGDYAAE